MGKLKQRYAYTAILLNQLVRTDFKLRYQGSLLGYLWSLLRPLMLFVILYVVFVNFLRVGEGVPHFPIYLLLGIVVWNYFVEVTNNSVTAIVGRGDLLRKLNFPKYVIVVSGSASAFINLCLNFIVVGVFMVLTGVDVSEWSLLAPFILLELVVFSLGLAFALSALYVRFRDVNYIWEVVLQAAFYATPILYPLSILSDKVSKLLLLNPMAQMIQDLRYMLVTPQANTISHMYGSQLIRLVPVGITVLVAVFGGWYFRSRSKYFAEEV